MLSKPQTTYVNGCKSMDNQYLSSTYTQLIPIHKYLYYMNVWLHYSSSTTNYYTPRNSDVQ